MGKVKDLMGQTFGMLTVVAPVGLRNNKMIWRCRCECGRITEIPGASLLSGNSKSCGCRRGVKAGAKRQPMNVPAFFQCQRCGAEVPNPNGATYIKHCKACAEETRRITSEQSKARQKTRAAAKAAEERAKKIRAGEKFNHDELAALAAERGMSYGKLQAYIKEFGVLPPVPAPDLTAVDWQACRSFTT